MNSSLIAAKVSGVSSSAAIDSGTETRNEAATGANFFPVIEDPEYELR